MWQAAVRAGACRMVRGSSSHPQPWQRLAVSGGPLGGRDRNLLLGRPLQVAVKPLPSTPHFDRTQPQGGTLFLDIVKAGQDTKTWEGMERMCYYGYKFEALCTGARHSPPRRSPAGSVY